MKTVQTTTLLLLLLAVSLWARETQTSSALHFSTPNDRFIYATDLIRNNIDIEQGLQLMRISAEENHAPAQFGYATYILRQLSATEDNLAESYAWASVILSEGNLPRYKTLTENAATEALTKLTEAFGESAVHRAQERADNYCKRYMSTN